MNAVVLAHQGGWDEFLMIAGPLLFLSLMVWMAARRFKSVESESLSMDRNAEDDTEKTFNNHRDTIEEQVS